MEPIPHLILATLVFLGAHFVSSTPLRRTLVEAFSERVYIGLYSTVSLVTIVWMVWAYTKAPYQALWQVPGLRLWPIVVMPFAFILIVAGLMTSNPTAVMQGGALKREEPARGIIRVTRHPVMWGIILWAAMHMLARGDLASLIFFGGFLFLAAAGTVLIDTRKADALGGDWTRFAEATSNVPFGAIVNGRNRFVFAEIGWKRIGVGLAAFVAFLLAHPFLFGARPY
jgi:uncharacterized membrane protein